MTSLLENCFFSAYKHLCYPTDCSICDASYFSRKLECSICNDAQKMRQELENFARKPSKIKVSRLLCAQKAIHRPSKFHNPKLKLPKYFMT